MKKYLTILVLTILSQQTLAATVAGIDFLDIATLDNSSTSGPFLTNYTTPGQTSQYSGGDGNAATFTYGADLAQDSILGLSFGSAVDVTAANLTLLLVGSDLHTGTVNLFGGSGGDSAAVDFSLLPYDSATGIFTGYTGFNSESADGNTTLGIFALTINLADAFGSDFGTFNGVQLQITGDNGSLQAAAAAAAAGTGGGYDAAPSLIGTTAAVIPVPAAVWLFGSGLIGLVGVARRKK